MNLNQSFPENRVAIPALRDATSIDKNQPFSLQSSRFVTSFSLKAPLLTTFLKSVRY